MSLKIRKKQRYKIEAKNAELKQSHGCRTCQFTGLFGMKIQAYVTAFVVSSKRIVRVIQLQKVKLQQQHSKIRQIMDIFEKEKRSLLFSK